MNNSKRLTWLLRSSLFLSVMLLLIAPSHAACYSAPNWRLVTTQMSGGLITVRPTDPVGTVLRTFTTRIPVEQSGVTPISTSPNGILAYTSGKCTGTGFTRAEIKKGVPVPGLYAVYSTNIPGIGVRLVEDVMGPSGSAQRLVISDPNRNFYFHPADASLAVFAGTTFMTEIVKTSEETGSGSLESGIYGITFHSGDGPGKPYQHFYLGADIITIVSPTCTVDSSSAYQRIGLQKINISDLHGARSTAAETPFDIKLNCTRGVGRTLDVMLAFQGTYDPATSPADGVLAQSLKTSDAAKNVGIQIVQRDLLKNPIFLGGELSVGPSKNGQYIVPFLARYFQTTAQPVTAGKVAASTTFIIQYR